MNEIEMMENIRNDLISKLSWLNKELSTYYYPNQIIYIEDTMEKYREQLRKTNLEITILEIIEMK